MKGPTELSMLFEALEQHAYKRDNDEVLACIEALNRILIEFDADHDNELATKRYHDVFDMTMKAEAFYADNDNFRSGV